MENPNSEIRKYKHIFFDLDHTIWDFDKNAEETLHELYEIYRLSEIGLPSAAIFIETYTRNNHKLWAEYHTGKITKTELRETRFKRTFIELGVPPDVLPVAFEDDYVKLCPTKTNLFPHAHETLQYLQSKYKLHLISNGFKEASTLKIGNTNIAQYFEQVIISEVVGVNKPDKAIFAHALNIAGAEKNESIMIGDSLEADVYGALNFGMDAIYFNPFNAPKPHDVPLQINGLKQLMEML
ncbi:YjjG family noncanonical pyrimidine nucleotidase [Mucilaginibacter sp. L3T2-6]|uniref:YjjG family noncanonical pyrimidine nucleotidase n=1 Tax=Mucilaginibacter sp. L3T2-6 TaxID=3062491 RepID=UPI002675D09C|nr:YjjG family noncanonical pyrimidine nucleotidase [Mucilaginibacter sp. L3T2-6]MDO3640683.1 YjjG family noncanonical pyrimidine nucleotidase [Mucilaginibacter sp. L3T2-6]MDV6212977.1 YjjG family noncanonical pyrimidine nucleotidase [Mucilaginibacter sp. L3T2-6]